MYHPTTQRGQLVLEVLLAIAVVGVAIVGWLSLSFRYLNTTIAANHAREAALISQEASEIVEGIARDDWASMNTGIYGLAPGTDGWEFSGGSDLVDDIYTRSVTVSTVDRDAESCEVVESGQQDPDTRLVQTLVTWEERGAQRSHVTSKYLTNWWSPIGDCGTPAEECSEEEPEEEELICIAIADYNYYLPFDPGSSGDYPANGSSSDSVTLSSQNPTSQGFLNLTLSFNGIPSNFQNPYITMRFTDLDLHGDFFDFGFNEIQLYETLDLIHDVQGTILSLGPSYPENDDFTWQADLPDSMVQSSTLELTAQMASDIELTQGNSITVSNSSEGLLNIELCEGPETPDPTCQGETMADCLVVNTSGAHLDSTKRRLQGIYLQNVCEDPITVDQMTTSWLYAGGGAPGSLRQIRIEGANAWHYNGTAGSPSGQQASGNTVDIDEVTIPGGWTMDIDRYRFSTGQANTIFTLGFTMSDASTDEVLTNYIP